MQFRQVIKQFGIILNKKKRGGLKVIKTYKFSY